MDAKSHIEPRLLKGFRDYLPREMAARQRIVDTTRQVYESYGFLPLGTPAQEYTLILLGKYNEESNKQIYRLESPEGEDVALRFDLTVPLARVVAMYQDLPKPFRRYQVGPVWRADKPDPGRFREFLQFDMDAVGCPSLATDAEMLCAMHDVFLRLRLDEFQIGFSSRKVLEGLVQYADIEPECALPVFRIIDKLEKIGRQGVREELTGGRLDASGDFIPGLKLDQSQVECIEKFLGLPKGGRRGPVTALKELFANIHGGQAGIDELEEICGYLDALSIDESRITVDLSIARGLDYYSGPVWEAKLLNAPQFGTVFAGGRYDGLVRRFSEEDIPATGASIGVDRLLAAMDHLGMVGDSVATAQVLVTVMDKAYLAEYLNMARQLRQAGIPAEVYTGPAKGVGKQLKYANQLRVPVAVVMGSDEYEKGQVAIKNLNVGIKEREGASRQLWEQTGKVGQTTVPCDQLIVTVGAMLAGVEQG